MTQILLFSPSTKPSEILLSGVAVRGDKPSIDDRLVVTLLEGREHRAALLDNDRLIGE